MIARMLWFLSYNSARGMYTFPRRDDVTDFVTSRLEVIIQNSPAIKNKMYGTDNLRLKQIGNSFLHFQEASVPPRMLDVDKLVNDEIDLSDPDALAQYPSRLDASRWKIHHKLSTPTVPGYGIDALYSQTDRKTWLIKCPRCGDWQKMEWDVNLRVNEVTDEAWYACRSCERVFAPWDIESGAWVAESTEGHHYGSGYQISQMMMPRMHPPTSLWLKFKVSPIKHFYNLSLGEPYRPPGGSVDRETFLENAFEEDVIPIEGVGRQNGRYYMSYDQGNDLYVMVGKYHNGAMQIVRAEVFPFEERGGWDRIRELFNAFQPRILLGDASPNRHPARDLTESLPKNRAFMAFYTESHQEYSVSKAEQKVSINRTEALDRARDAIHSGGIKLAGRRMPLLPSMSRVVDHCTSIERDEEIRHAQAGDKIIGVWRPTGPDHFFHCLAYILVAHEMRPAGAIRINVIGSKAPGRDEEYERVLKKQVVWKSLR